ncbi:unnamed protein product [Bemisia tabaci]|uniref:Uncharacterized protein n=1 Tax=Bemisia tabaci TaxID=7038 RepID=A0A9P0APT5_BEMTA|nr:unnamed protein product [Bemisia tabaci]
MPTTRKDTSVYLIGNYCQQIIGSKLPSNGDALRVLFFNLREVQLNLRQSFKLVIEEILTFWNKARIPTKFFCDCVKKLEALYDTWRNLQKSSHRKSNAAKETDFVNKLDDLFDISHENAMDLIKLEEDRKFLVAQRKPGREGFMHGIDWDLSKKEERAEARENKRLQREEKYRQSLLSSCSDAGECSTQCEPESSIEGRAELEEEEEDDQIEPREKRQRGSKKILTLKVVAALDKAKLSDRNATHILIAVIEALGLDPVNFSINRTSLQDARIKLRKERAAKLKENFKNVDLGIITIHWDGKLMKELLGSDKCDRIAIILTSGDVEQILSIPEIKSSTGREQAEAIYEQLIDWDLDSKFHCLCCDTTNSNLGVSYGAAVILEKMLGRSILCLPCRHHMFELVLRAAFDAKMPASTSPEVPIFKRFKEAWPKMDHSNFLVADDNVMHILENDKEGILAFTQSILDRKEVPRDDYREFLILSQIFLGKFTGNVKFAPPGPIHHARWMAKAIYCLKIYLFRNQFDFKDNERESIEALCIFIVKVYIRAWFKAPLTIQAPNHDLKFLMELDQYANIDPFISEACINKFSNHLWYLTPQMCALSFFDSNVSDKMKKKND